MAAGTMPATLETILDRYPPTMDHGNKRQQFDPQRVSQTLVTLIHPTVETAKRAEPC